MKKPAEKTTSKPRAASAKAAEKKPSASKAAATKSARPEPSRRATPAPKASVPVSAEAIAAGEALIARFSRHSSHRAVAAAVSKRPFFLRRDPMENIATAIIGLGFLMMFQPFVMQLYTWSFVTMLFGTVMFIIVSKFPE
jgi:hypothetical protein